MSTGILRLSHCTSLISKSSRKRWRSGTRQYLPSLAASLSKRIEHGRQTHMISRVETSNRCRCSDGIGSPHRSQYSCATSAAFAVFSDSSFANRRNEKKGEEAFLLPCSTIYPSAHSAREGDLYYASPPVALTLLDGYFVHQQRDGLHMQLRVVQASPGPAHVVAVRASRASEYCLVQSTPLQRFSAAGAEVAVGVEVVPQLQEEHRLVGDLLHKHPATGELGQPADDGPGSSVLLWTLFLLFAQGRTGYDGRRRLGLLGHAFGLYTLQIRCGLLYGFLYRQPERHGGGRAPTAAPLHPQSRHALLHAQQLHIPTVGLQVGTHLFEGHDYPRLQVERVQPVQEQQMRDQLVLGEGIESSLAFFPFGDHLHHTRQALTVEIQENPYHLGGLGPGVPVWERFDLPQQSLHPGDALL